MERQSISQLVHQGIPKFMEGFLLYSSSRQRPSSLQLVYEETLSLLQSSSIRSLDFVYREKDSQFWRGARFLIFLVYRERDRGSLLHLVYRERFSATG